MESSARAFQRDLYFYWSNVRANPLSLTKGGRLYKRDLRLANAALLQPEEIGQRDELDMPRLLFLRLLLTDLGLLRQVGQTVQATERPPFLAQAPMERIQRTFTLWRDGTFWNEILSVPNVTIVGVQSRLNRAPAQICRARRRVLDHLAELYKARGSEAHWTPISRLIERMRTTDYEFLLPRDYFPLQSLYYRQYHGYLSHASPYISYGNEMGWSFSPPFSDEAEGWQVVEAGFILAVMIEPLHWMGLLDIGYIADSAVADSAVGDVPIAYRLTPVGAWVLGVGPQVDIPEEEGRVVVQPNFELFALDPISDLTLSRLDEFAERISAERAIKYRLTRESVYRAQKRGWTAARIIDTLRELSHTGPAEPPPLPQNVVRTLEEWQSLHERVTVHRRTSLLQAVDGQLLDRLAEKPAIASHLVNRVDEDASQGTALALISPALGEAEELVRALEEMGYPPMRTRSPQDAVRPSLTVVDSAIPDGAPSGMAIQFHVALPSFYLFEQLAPFTSHDEQGRYYLTPSAVQGAIERGMSVDEILDRLRALHRGPLSHSVEKQIRAWGHYYGDAAVQTITLIQVQDAKTLNELLSEPEVRAVLRPFVPDPGRALALVGVGDLKSLYEVLAKYGINVHDQLAQASIEVQDHATSSDTPTTAHAERGATPNHGSHER